MAESENEEAVKLRHKSLYHVLKSPSSTAPPASTKHKPSYFLTESLREMVNEDPIRLRNQSCVIREESVKIGKGEHLVHSSLAHLPTFSIGLSNTQGENPPADTFRNSNVTLKDKSLHSYFQMPELGARVFVGDSDGFETIICHLFKGPPSASKFHLDSEYSAVRSLYKDDRPRGLNNWLQAQPTMFWKFKDYSEVILSGTELFVDPTHISVARVGNLRENLRVSSSITDYKDCTSGKTIVEQPKDPLPGVFYFWGDHWVSVEDPDLQRSNKGSYLERPKFTKMDDQNSEYYPSKGDALQLTRFDDFVILGNRYLSLFNRHKVIDIVQKNAFETVDVIAAKLVKGVMEECWPLFLDSITIIVIFLDHKEILLREHKKEKKENMDQKDVAILAGLKEISQSIVLKDDKEIAKLEEEEEKIITLEEEEERMFASTMEDNKGFRVEDHKVKILVDEPLPNLAQISIVSLEKNEFGMESRAPSSNPMSAKVQDDSEALSSVVLIEDDCKSEDFMISHHITKWIIYGDLVERTLLCFFDIEEMRYEFYFEDHKSMATIIGLGVPHSKVVLECGSPHVTVVEILEKDWDVVWAYSTFIPSSIPKGNVSKQEQFPHILHSIANMIDFDNNVSKANDGGVRRDKGKGKAQGNATNSKGKTQDHDKHGNTSHGDDGFDGVDDGDGKKERKRKDGNDNNKDSCEGEDGKTSNDLKEIKVKVYLRLLPGGVLERKEKNKELREVREEKGEKLELREVHEEKGEKLELGEVLEEGKKGEKMKLGEVHEEEGEKMELGKVHEEEGEKMKLGKICEEEIEKEKMEEECCKLLEKEKKNIFARLRHALKRGKNGIVVENQQEWTTIEGVENGDVDENLQKQVENRIHSNLEFTFTIKDEAEGQLKTIQASICPIIFQLPLDNEENYSHRRRFGWFHDHLKVAFGVVDTQVAYLDLKSCKILDSSKAKVGSLQGNAKGNAKKNTNTYKGELGIKHYVNASGTYVRTNEFEDKTSEEVQNTWETNKILTHDDGFLIRNCTDYSSHQFKYWCRPRHPFNVNVFELKDEDDREMEYFLNPICHLQQVCCQGTWRPYDLENLEAYKLEASRELRMTRVYNLDLETGEEKKQKKVPKVEKNLLLCFIQKLETVVYLNHAMSHLTSSTIGEYDLREKQDGTNQSTELTQGQYNKEPRWPSNILLIELKQYRNI